MPKTTKEIREFVLEQFQNNRIELRKAQLSENLTKITELSFANSQLNKILDFIDKENN